MSDDFYKRGTQIAYIPAHANGDVRHPDVEFGFVTSDAGVNGVFCRFWAKRHLPISAEEVDGFLQTKSCSKLVPRELIVQRVSVPPECVQEALKKYC